jgi:hypothetical protein
LKPNKNLPGNNTPDPGTTKPPATGPNFIDVAAGHWVRANILNAHRKGLMTGVEVKPNGDIRFDPEGTLTKAQVAQILYNAYGAKMVIGYAAERDYADVGGSAWYYTAVDWAVKHGLMDAEYEGEKAYFRPNDPAPRYLVAEALYRLAGKRRKKQLICAC